MRPIELSLIVAMTTKRIIGNRGALPWGRLPSDMTHFKKVTMEAGTVIMGRKTWESIPEKFRPLPGRKNIVLTRGPIPAHIPDSVYYVKSVENACAEAARHGTHACITGGEVIYRLFLWRPELVKAYITVVNAPDLVGDAYFPELETGMESEADAKWICTEMSGFQKWDPADEHETSFRLYERPR